jgi:hypothetical protein
MKGRAAGLASHAPNAARSTASPSDARWSDSPIIPDSQPTPVDPGPNMSQNGFSTWQVWARRRRVPSPSDASVTSTQLVLSAKTQVTRNRSWGSHSSTSPPALPSSW